MSLGAGVPLPAKFEGMEDKPRKPMSEMDQEHLFGYLNLTINRLCEMVEDACDCFLTFEIGIRQLLKSRRRAIPPPSPLEKRAA